MTDREKLIKVFTEIGVEHDAEFRTNCVELNEGKGYGGFACQFMFDSGGKFLHHACYE